MTWRAFNCEYCYQKIGGCPRSFTRIIIQRAVMIDGYLEYEGEILYLKDNRSCDIFQPILKTRRLYETPQTQKE
jgi:hypothetical protein